MSVEQQSIPKMTKLTPIGPYEAECEWDCKSDCLLIRVRRRYLDENGKTIKKGFMFKASEEFFYWVAEGQIYQTVKLPIDNRFAKLIE